MPDLYPLPQPVPGPWTNFNSNVSGITQALGQYGAKQKEHQQSIQDAILAAQIKNKAELDLEHQRFIQSLSNWHQMLGGPSQDQGMGAQINAAQPQQPSLPPVSLNMPAMSLAKGGVGDVQGNPVQPVTPQPQPQNAAVPVQSGNTDFSTKFGKFPFIPDPSSGKMIKNPYFKNKNEVAQLTDNLPQLGADAKPEEKDSFLKQLSPGDSAIVKGLTDYKLDLSKAVSMRSGDRQKYAALASMYDPTFDMNQYNARQKFLQSLKSGPLQKSIISANTLIGHINGLSDSFSKLHNAKVPLMNAIGNSYKQNIGQGEPIAVKTNADAVANELENLFRGTGGGSLQGIQEWRKNVSVNASPEQQKAFIQKAIELMASRIDAVNSQYENVLGKPKDFSVLTDKSRKILQNLGISTEGINTPDFQGVPQSSGGKKSGGILKQDAQGNRAMVYPDGTFEEVQ